MSKAKKVVLPRFTIKVAHPEFGATPVDVAYTPEEATIKFTDWLLKVDDNMSVTIHEALFEGKTPQCWRVTRAFVPDNAI